MCTTEKALKAILDPVELPKAILDLVNHPRVQDQTADPGTHSVDLSEFAPGRTLSIYRPTANCGYRVVGIWEGGECLAFNLVYDVPCTRCSKMAVWMINKMPYCKYHAPDRVREVIGTEGIVSRFYCHAGFALHLGQHWPRPTMSRSQKGA